jgi:hypothetical protein
MAGLHVHLRAVTLAGLVGTAMLVAASCSCSDRPVDESPEARSEPACLWLILPHGHRADGSVRVIMDYERSRSGTACLCLTEEEYDSLGDRLERARFPEEGTILEEFNELAYDECKRLAALIEGIVDDECLDYYEQGMWLKDIYFARGGYANGAPPGFTCDE